VTLTLVGFDRVLDRASHRRTGGQVKKHGSTSSSADRIAATSATDPRIYAEVGAGGIQEVFFVAAREVVQHRSLPTLP